MKKEIKKNKMSGMGNVRLLIVLNCVQVILIVFLLIYVLKFSTPSISDNTTIDNKSEKRENYVLLGDSITSVYPISDFFSYGTPIVNSGFSGFKTSDLLKDMDKSVYRYNPSKVFIEIGTNDLNDENISKEEIYNNIVSIANNIKTNRPYAKIYIESIYPINRGNDRKIDLAMVGRRENIDIVELNKKLKSYCENNEVEYIDIYSKLADEEGNLRLEYTKEGLHLSNEGYSVVSDILKKYIKEW